MQDRALCWLPSNDFGAWSAGVMAHLWIGRPTFAEDLFGVERDMVVLS